MAFRLFGGLWVTSIILPQASKQAQHMVILVAMVWVMVIKVTIVIIIDKTDRTDI